MSKSKKLVAILMLGAFIGSSMSVFMAPASGVAKRHACNQNGKANGHHKRDLC
jgi:gas vesicle protein